MSVVVQVCLVGFTVSIGSKAGLESVLLAVGDVCLIEVSLYCVTYGPDFGIIKLAPYSDAAVIQSMVSIHSAAEMLALCCTATQTPVVKLSVPRATQTAVIQVSLRWAAQAGVVEVTGATTPKAEVIEVKVEETALCAGKCHKTALCVPTPEVVVIPRRRVRGGA